MDVEEISMPERELLMVPGPSIVDPEVLRATSRSTESHMHRPFAEKLGVVFENLKRLFVTDEEVFAIAGSGTLAQEVGLAREIQTKGFSKEIEMNEKEFAEARNALKNRLENHILEACYKFEEEWRNWDHLQEEFPDEHTIDVFLEEVVNEVLEELGENGINL